jgi:hypothetical protein
VDFHITDCRAPPVIDVRQQNNSVICTQPHQLQGLGLVQNDTHLRTHTPRCLQGLEGRQPSGAHVAAAAAGDPARDETAWLRPRFFPQSYRRAPPRRALSLGRVSKEGPWPLTPLLNPSPTKEESASEVSASGPGYQPLASARPGQICSFHTGRQFGRLRTHARTHRPKPVRSAGQRPPQSSPTEAVET